MRCLIPNAWELDETVRTSMGVALAVMVSLDDEDEIKEELSLGDPYRDGIP